MKIKTTNQFHPNTSFYMQFDYSCRYFDHISKTLATAHVPAYFTFDARIAYQYKGFKFAVIGQDFSKNKHKEFDVLFIPSIIYGKITCRF